MPTAVGSQPFCPPRIPQGSTEPAGNPEEYSQALQLSLHSSPTGGWHETPKLSICKTFMPWLQPSCSAGGKELPDVQWDYFPVDRVQWG